jgi:hypothetical protein
MATEAPQTVSTLAEQTCRTIFDHLYRGDVGNAVRILNEYAADANNPKLPVEITVLPGFPVIGYNINPDKLAKRIGCSLEDVQAATRRMAEADGLDSVLTGDISQGQWIIHQAAANRIYAELTR